MLTERDKVIAIGSVAMEENDELFCLAPTGGLETRTFELLHGRCCSCVFGAI